MVFGLEVESDLSEARAVGAHAEPGGAVKVERGESSIQGLDEAEGFEGEASFLLLTVDSDYSLDIPVTP